MVAQTQAPIQQPRLRFLSTGRGLIEVYDWRGGANVLGLLNLRRDGGTLLVNRHMVAAEGLRVMTGWALGIAGYQAIGWFALLTADLA